MKQPFGQPPPRSQNELLLINAIFYGMQDSCAPNRMPLRYVCIPVCQVQAHSKPPGNSLYCLAFMYGGTAGMHGGLL